MVVSMKLNEFAKLYLENHAITQKKSWKKDLSYINRLILPTFGNAALKSIKRMDVIVWFNTITAVNGPVSANRAQEVFRKMYNCAIDWEMYDGRNPITRIKRNKENSRSEFISPDILPRLLLALTTCNSRDVRAMVLVQLLTGLRPGEVRGLEWGNVNLTGRLLTVVGTKNGKSHTLPISDELALILQALPQEGRWVFPGTNRSQSRNTIYKQWYKIRDAAGLPTLRLHDLRRTVGSYLAIANFSERIIGDVLNHQSPESTRIYSRLNLEPKREALNYQGAQIYQIANDAGLESPHHLLSVDRQLSRRLPVIEAA